MRIAVAFILLAALVTGAGSAQAHTFKVTIAAKSPLYAPYFIAIDKGYYKKEGLDVKLVEAAGGIATPALISGSVDVSTSAASSVAAILRGAPLKIVYTMADRLPDQLWTSQPSLHTLKDMKGLTVGIASRGDSFEIALRSMLEADRLPQNWLGYSPLGYAGSVRLSALLSGSMPAVMITPVDVKPALASGALAKCCHLMIDFVKVLRLPYTGAAVSDRLLARDPAAVASFLRGTIKGVRYALAFEQQTVAILAKRNPQLNPAIIRDIYRITVPTMTKIGTASDALIHRDLKVRAAILGMDPKDLPPINAIYDYRLTRKVTAELDASGWQPTP